MTTALTGTDSSARVVSRSFADPDDFLRVRQFLIETYPLTPTGLNWGLSRWDSWNCSFECPNRDELVHLWETEAGQLVGAAHAEGSGEVYFELHPDYRALEAKMLDWAETDLAVNNEEGHKQLHVFCLEYDVPRRRLLEGRGYTKLPWIGVTWRMRFGRVPLPVVTMPFGYVLRSLHPSDADDQRIADVINAGFDRSDQTAQEFRAFRLKVPGFNCDLHLVAEAPDGSFAAYAGVTYDDVNRRGMFEPVCTHPDHRRKGLARVLMIEGLRRLFALGATDAYVDTGDEVPANALYEAVGFTEVYTGSIWRKVF